MKMNDKLRNIRKSKGLSQEFIADTLGYKSFTTIQKWESGLSEPPIGKLSQLAKLYNIPITALLDDDNENNTKDSLVFEYPLYEDDFKALLSPSKRLSTVILPHSIMGKYAKSTDIFFIRLQDDSLNKYIPRYSLLGINTKFDKAALKNNTLVFFKYRNKLHCYYFYASNGKFIFKPASTLPAYTDLEINPADFSLDIIGVVFMYSVFIE